MLFSLAHLRPRTGFAVCGCNDKDIANAFPTDLRAPVATLGADTFKPYPSLKLYRCFSLFILPLKETHQKALGDASRKKGTQLHSFCEHRGSGDFQGDKSACTQCLAVLLYRLVGQGVEPTALHYAW